jgi:Ca2+-binding EF-hand superfamily protein
MKLTKFISNIIVLLAMITCGSNALQLRDSGKSVQSADSNIEETSFLEKGKHKSHVKVKKPAPKKKPVGKKSRTEAETLAATASKSKSKSEWAQGTQNSPPVAAFKAPYKNDTLSRANWRDLNNTMVRQTVNIFLPNHRKWDFKMLDHQLQDIALDMNYREEYGHTQEGLRAFIRFFINYFESCDTDGDNQLSRKEFRKCMKNDTFLMIIDIPSKNYSALSANPLDYTNATTYADTLFDLLDPHESAYINFHSYMTLRLFVFSWRRCSVAAPFIEESNFECAIEIAAGWKTMNRNTVRKLFFLGLEMSGSIDIRNLDFVTYVSFAQAVRLYGKINGKEDNDITRNEFNLALDNNILPLRYNQDTINIFFKLIEDKDVPNQGFDVLTFAFYDFFLKMYHKEAPTGTYYLFKKHFVPIFQSQLMPYWVNLEFLKIPQGNLTAHSYQMYTYLNVSNYQDESDHFLKSFIEKKSSEDSVEESSFLETEKSSKWSTLEIRKNLTAFKFDAKKTFESLFNVIDSDMDGMINFYDFGSMIQISYMFTHFDKYYKGRNTAGELYEKFYHYSDFPMVNFRTKERAKIFNEFPQDLYVDLYSCILTLKVEDLFGSKVRRLDKNLVTEIELKHVLGDVNRRHVPDWLLNRCLRGTTKDNIPTYDWECAFVQSEIATMTYWENSFDRLTVSKNNLVLANTVFYNIDPNLPQQGSIPDEEKHHGYEIKY